MATIPAFTDGTVSHQADLAFALKKPYAKVYQSGTGQVIATATDVAMIWTNVSVDGSPDTMFSVSFNTRLTVHTPGVWTFRACVAYPQNVTGGRQLLLEKNGTTAITWLDAAAVNATYPSQIILTADDVAAAGDYYEIICNQNSGASLTTITGVARTWFVAEWVRS